MDTAESRFFCTLEGWRVNHKRVELRIRDGPNVRWPPIRMLTIVDEFTREWLGRVGVKTLYIEPGSPWENGYVESFFRYAS